MAVSETERALRIITILSWIPAMGLLIPFGRFSDLVVPTLGLIPMSISALFGVQRLCIKGNRRGCTIFMDAFIAAFLLGIATPGIVIMARHREFIFSLRGNSFGLLGAFATAPLLLNLCIHVFFVLRETSLRPLLSMMFTMPTCPHCNRDLRLLWDMTPGSSTTASNDGKSGYADVAQCAEHSNGQSGPSALTTPRPSGDYDTETLTGDDESASLV